VSSVTDRLPQGWKWIQVRHLSRNLDYLRIPKNSAERSQMVGDVPYWGANAVQGFVNRALVDGQLVLVGEDGAPFFDPIASVAFAIDYPIWPNNHVHVIRPAPGVDYRFLAASLNAVDYSLYVKGSTRDKLNQSELSGILLAIPSLETQSHIANYLDRETAKIDEFIADQEELIGLLAERRLSVLLQATLGGHIELRGQLGKFIRKEERPILGPETVTAFRDGQVTARANRREDGFTMSEADSGYQGVAVGDLVFHGLDGFAGAVGVSDSIGRCSPVYHVCSVKADLNAEFMGLYLRALGVSGFLEAYAWSVRQRSVDYRNWATFSKLPVGLPPIHDQERAVVHVGADWAELDAAIADAREAISLSLERRAALISAAVTGKIDVRDHGAVA
jgi:type I restriction enzyme S subunit